MNLKGFLAVCTLAVTSTAHSATAETVSDLVAAGHVTVSIAIAPNGQWAWMYLGESADKPLYVCQIETPTHPNPADTCRKLK